MPQDADSARQPYHRRRFERRRFKFKIDFCTRVFSIYYRQNIRRCHLPADVADCRFSRHNVCHAPTRDDEMIDRTLATRDDAARSATGRQRPSMMRFKPQQKR